jgi:hypothetical protein
MLSQSPATSTLGPLLLSTRCAKANRKRSRGVSIFKPAGPATAAAASQPEKCVHSVGLRPTYTLSYAGLVQDQAQTAACEAVPGTDIWLRFVTAWTLITAEKRGCEQCLAFDRQPVDSQLEAPEALCRQWQHANCLSLQLRTHSWLILEGVAHRH